MGKYNDSAINVSRGKLGMTKPELKQLIKKIKVYFSVYPSGVASVTKPAFNAFLDKVPSELRDHCKEKMEIDCSHIPELQSFAGQKIRCL